MQSCKWSTITSPACPHRKYLVDFLCTVPLLVADLSFSPSLRLAVNLFDSSTEQKLLPPLVFFTSHHSLSPLLSLPLSFSLEWLYNGVRRRRNHQRHRHRRRRRAALPRNPVQPASERVPRGEGRIGYTPPLTKRAKGVPLPRASLPRPGSARQAVPTRDKKRRRAKWVCLIMHSISSAAV